MMKTCRPASPGTCAVPQETRAQEGDEQRRDEYGGHAPPAPPPGRGTREGKGNDEQRRG